MRHGKAGKKLGRTPSHRKAMFRNMVSSLLKDERMVTTEVKAKEVGRLAEKMITLGKRGDLHARRQAVAYIRSNEVVKKIFSVYAQRFAARDGGYTRVLKLEPRAGDNAPMAIVELVDRPVKESKEKKETKGKKESKAKKEPKAQSPKPKEKKEEAKTAEKKESKPGKAPAKKTAEKKEAGAKPKKASASKKKEENK